MAGFRNNEIMYVGGIILAVVLCSLFSESHSQIVSEEEYQERLERMSKTSDPVSDESLKSVESSVQQEMLHKAGDGHTQLRGFDAWIAKQQLRKSQHAQSTVVRKDSKKSSRTIYVAQDGSGDFGTVQGALNSIPNPNSGRVIIFIKAGTYYERLIIPEGQKYVALVGEGADRTQISGDATAGDEYGKEDLLNTYRSCTVGVNSDYFVAKDILFQNTALPPEPGAIGNQAVALRISGDKATLFNVAVLGAQDTLYDHQGRHYFHNCFIQGSIDFLFGNGRSYYKHCEQLRIPDSPKKKSDGSKRGLFLRQCPNRRNWHHLFGPCLGQLLQSRLLLVISQWHDPTSRMERLGNCEPTEVVSIAPPSWYTMHPWHALMGRCSTPSISATALEQTFRSGCGGRKP